jgi:quercetin dioxygenase-like cupin family protein
MRTFQYPHTISNGAGETLTFVRRVPGKTGPRLEGNNVVAPGQGPVMHVHYYQEEALTVRSGTIGYQRLGEAEQFAGVGETVTFKAGEAHRFWNAGTDELHCDAYIEPADNIEYFLSEIFDSARRAGSHRPNLFEAAYLARRYRSEFKMLEVPDVVQRFIFPVMIAIGHALGKYDRYRTAPQPIVR